MFITIFICLPKLYGTITIFGDHTSPNQLFWETWGARVSTHSHFDMIDNFVNYE